MTDIASDAIKWLCDDPTFSTEHRATIGEVLKALGAEDPDDPLLVALVIEGVNAQRGGPAVVATATGWKPELCGNDASARRCDQPISGTGRCMTCGSQRREPEAADPAIKAAQQSDQELPDEEMSDADAHLTAIIEDAFEGDEAAAAMLDYHAFGTGIIDGNGKHVPLQDVFIEPVLPLDGPPPAHVHRRDKRIRRPSRLVAHVHVDAPSAGAVESMKARVLEGARGDLPMMWRIKRLTGLSDDDLGAIIGRKRATVQAYAQSNRTEVLGPNQLDALGDVLKLHYDVLADLLLEIEAAKCP